jgi:hypothetical protein
MFGERLDKPLAVRRCWRLPMPTKPAMTAEHRRLEENRTYFHGDNGAGLGASHRTGWTGLLALLFAHAAAAGVQR